MQTEAKIHLKKPKLNLTFSNSEELQSFKTLLERYETTHIIDCDELDETDQICTEILGELQ